MTLQEWRKENRYSQAAFARLVEGKTQRIIDKSTVHHWEHGTEPRIYFRRAIEEITNGQVRADAFGKKGE